jgi:hypothetical protein
MQAGARQDTPALSAITAKLRSAMLLRHLNELFSAEPQ